MLKLGVTPWDLYAPTAASLARQAQRAEGLGYDSFWLPENHFNAQAIPEPLMALAAVAAGTRRLRLGTTSLLLTLRHPLALAEQVAVLDQLSEGRVVLGVGRGYAPRLFEAFGVDVRAKRRVFEAALAQMRAAWAGEPLADDDAGVELWPRPVQQPHPPLWVAAFGPKALSQAGRLGLPYLASPVEALDALADNYARHREAARAAGHGAIDTVPVMRSVYLTDSRREAERVRSAVAAAALARPLPGSLTAAPVDDWAIIGDAGLLRERVAEYRERLGMTHLLVTRLRLEGLDREAVERSVARVGEQLA